MSPATHLCPYCGYRLDAATSLSGADLMPEAGDASICIRCEAVLVFTGDGLGVRRPTDAELTEIVREHDILAIQKAIRASSREDLA